ncbi:hypothetical protein GMOD_00007827 [Pyrenophora seminiperda CCB06]|uniref:Uncharacterized protein n=1 Tax=Pyrenophora seminiperda CCB06 TaxID=1302712 RepID=A0A3M7MFL7_9PLEO|nr:hypothetical protein GMOD_00007827 [Pyrenophora seminiperda CCB06]
MRFNQLSPSFSGAMAHNIGTHERDLRTLTALADSSDKEQCYSELSFCVPTSLAFAKRLQWEQTPWVTTTVGHNLANPICAADAHLIAYHLQHQLGQDITPSAIQNALLFGSTYILSEDGRTSVPGTYPQLFVVFPHADTSAAKDENFLKIWHDDIVIPAFNHAWAESGLVPISGAHRDSTTRILPPRGTTTPRDALPFIGFLAHLQNGNPTPVRTDWPSWRDPSFPIGTEGKHTGLRSTIYASAWTSIEGMLKDHPDLPHYQSPVLLALCRVKVFVNTWLNAKDRFRCSAEEWDRCVDRRWMQEGSFKVVESVVMGTMDDGDRMVAREERKKLLYARDVKGNVYKKRTWEDDRQGRKDKDEVDVDVDADAHRSKRVKT